MLKLSPALPATFACLLLLLASGTADAGRYESFTKQAAAGPKLNVVAATFWGGPDMEEFLAGGGLPDGRIVALGNAWGKSFPDSPKPLVLGAGTHSGAPLKISISKGRETVEVVDRTNPDIAACMVVFDEKGQSIKSVVRFDWGVGRMTAGTVTADGQVILLGHCGPSFASVARLAATSVKSVAPEAPPATAPARGRRRVANPWAKPTDVFAMKLSPDGAKIQWLAVVQGLVNNDASPRDLWPKDVWLDKQGAVYFQADGLHRISPDGKSLTRLEGAGGFGGRVGVRAVDPADGTYYVGGDRNTHTGKEPWRQPFFHKINAQGEKLWTLWQWPSRGLRDGSLAGLQGDVSDTAIGAAAFLSSGEILVAAWSDGGNTIFRKQPLDGTKAVPAAPWRMDSSGMKGANSLLHLVKLDPRTRTCSLYALWTGYLPDNFQTANRRGAPNGMSIRGLVGLADGSFAVITSAATGFIQTPNAFVKPPSDGSKYHGMTVAVFDHGITGPLFSSYLPGSEVVNVGSTRKGLAVFSRSKGSDEHRDEAGKDLSTPSPAINALQGKFGGASDGHLVIMERP